MRSCAITSHCQSNLLHYISFHIDLHFPSRYCGATHKVFLHALLSSPLLFYPMQPCFLVISLPLIRTSTAFACNSCIQYFLASQVIICCFALLCSPVYCAALFFAQVSVLFFSDLLYRVALSHFWCSRSIILSHYSPFSSLHCIADKLKTELALLIQSHCFLIPSRCLLTLYTAPL